MKSNKKIPDSARGPQDRRAFLTAALLGAAGGVPAIAGAAEEATPAAAGSRPVKIKGLSPPDAPAADVGYTPGILAEGQRLVFNSGQGPRDYNADMETQFRQTFERIKVILEQAGGSMRNIVILRAYFVHFNRDLPVYRKVRKEYLVQPYPASTAVGVTELAPAGNQIEIEAVAVL
jgi:enamine deaminase RidA (YjgF/YER057c/UK114 family)